MGQIVIINCGISGAGKSTFTLKKIREGYFVVNRDSIRKSLVYDLKNYYQRSDLINIEEIVTKLQREQFNELLFQGKSVVVDDTNLTEVYVNYWLRQLDSFSIMHSLVIDHRFKLFPIELKEAQNRVYKRDYLNSCTPFVYDDNHSEDMKVQYIEKQYRKYKQIENYINKRHSGRLL